MSIPLVSCICPTYGRGGKELQLLEETIYWFEKQETSISRELVILNDAPNQKLKCNSPGVRIINAPKRYPSLGDKYNALVALARGEIILPWEDDDISLPHRIKESVSALTHYDYWNPQKSWFHPKGEEPKEDNRAVNHNTSAYRRGLFCYRSCNDQDMWVDMDAKAAGRVAPPGSVRVYVYRWGVSSYHLSGMNGLWNQVPPPESGEWEIKPKMYYDYGKL